MKITYDRQLLSDLHKEAYGMRPRSDFLDNFDNNLNEEQRQNVWDLLLEISDARQKEQQTQQRLAVTLFNFKVIDYANKMGASARGHKFDTLTLVRCLMWEFKKRGLNLSDDNDISQYEHDTDLPFGHIKKMLNEKRGNA